MFLSGIGLLSGMGLGSWWYSDHGDGTPIGKTDTAIDDICAVYSLIRQESPGCTSPPSLYSILNMDVQEPQDKKVDIKAWKASIAAIGDHLGTETRQEKIFIRAAGILMDGPTRSVYDNQVWNKILRREYMARRKCHAYDENPAAKEPLCPLTQPTFKFDNNMVAGDMRLCARQIQRYYQAECDTPLKDGTQQDHSAVEEKANFVTHQLRTPRPTSLSKSAPTVTIPLETNPWQSTGPHVAPSSEPLPQEPPEAQSHHEYARSWSPALGDQANTSDQTPTTSEFYDDSQQPTRRALGARPWDLRGNQHEGAARESPVESTSQEYENESWLYGAPATEPVTDSRNDSQDPQTYHDVEELLTPDNFAKYKRYRRREKRAGRG
ncbi:unnamed protein product [Fusarium fujikuroi]|uniref:J domain-containing protein n=1 Tax=Fusarium fujikuroi TaxID=5127 RepID=A0A9Q9UFD0_FUSFU|nr:unnamed protein product [Fusarium fujikuroi]VTT79691.1 unnamed protein product [Fusarium fujikuroi]VZH99329.1 unnamed protein product [Fusarium fujikuroi]